MNKRRRRFGRRRRHWARVKREMQAWTRVNDAWTSPPKRGRLRAPVLALRAEVDRQSARAMQWFATFGLALKDLDRFVGLRRGR